MNRKFVNKDGVSTDQMREMLDKYLKLDSNQKDNVKEQLGCSKSMNEMEFLTHIRVMSLHRNLMGLLGM